MISNEASQPKARLYWPYAAMAAHVYRTKGENLTPKAFASTSPYLNAEIEDDDDREFLRSKLDDEIRLERKRVVELINENDCFGVECSAFPTDANPFSSRAAPLNDPSKCNFNAGKDAVLPYVPINELLQMGWRPAPELQRRRYPEPWRIFVPGLVIDVWRRALNVKGATPKVEYAIVYRGTDDNGGWVSNLRTILAATPFVWDQYRQANAVTKDIVAQIKELHKTSDDLFNRKENKTDILITAVGHSLGGGIATYVFLRVPEITMVVGFDPSPVNGSFSTSVSQLASRESDPNGPPFINFLFESGSPLEKASFCKPGRIRADVPSSVSCDIANLSYGNRFDQHNISQMSCKLYLVDQGVIFMNGDKTHPMP